MRIIFYIQPGAKKNKFVGFHRGMPKIKIHAKAENNQANLELISFIAELLKIPKSKITIISGNKSRIKTLEIPDGSSTTIFQSKGSQLIMPF